MAGRTTIVDEIELVMRERPYLPWYERYGPDFLDVMWRYPLDQREPPKEWDGVVATSCGPGSIYLETAKKATFAVENLRSRK